MRTPASHALWIAVGLTAAAACAQEPAPPPSQEPAQQAAQEATQQPAPGAVELNQRGLQSMYAGDLDSAQKDFDQAMTLRPDWPTPLANRGYAGCLAHDFAAGKADVDEALRRLGQAAPAADRSSVRYARASCLVLLGRTKEAIVDFSAAIEADPDSSDALVARGLARGNEKDYEGAKADLGRAHALKPDSAAIEMMRGHVSDVMGELDDAVGAYEHAIALATPSASALNDLCAARSLLGKSLDKALAECDESLRLQPDFPEALDSRATVNLRLGRLKEAVDDATAALERKPDLASSYFVRAAALRRLGVAEAAQRDLAHARQIDPGVEESFARYGVAP